jgi:hypothetical protein
MRFDALQLGLKISVSRKASLNWILVGGDQSSDYVDLFLVVCRRVFPSYPAYLEPFDHYELSVLENAPNHPPDHLQLSVSVASSFTPGIFIEDDSHNMSMSEARPVIEDRD